jgi:hypothetical protein
MPEDITTFNNFTNKITNPFWRFIFMITKLPAAFFSGVRLVSVNENDCIISVKHTWFTKNPFKSIYFACLAMAAEMSTGILAMGHTFQLSPPVGMLVSEVRANFIKKATGKITFVSKDGEQIMAAVNNASTNGVTTFVETTSIGTNEEGIIVAHFIITWAFKLRKNSI